MESVSRAWRLTVRPSRARRLMTRSMIRSGPLSRASSRPGRSCAPVTGAVAEIKLRAANTAASQGSRMSRSFALEADLARPGEMHVHQGVEQPDPLAPEPELLGAAEPGAEQVEQLELPVHRRDPIFQLLGHLGGTPVEHVGVRIEARDRLLQLARLRHRLGDLARGRGGIRPGEVAYGDPGR